ncbi:MAG: hypothetical protein BWY64_03045 [bacterium ADurb.Bin363]|nr:MAG: hypothetical protein BWY64_03045 [bacterium ADurb.Bin363]
MGVAFKEARKPSERPDFLLVIVAGTALYSSRPDLLRKKLAILAERLDTSAEGCEDRVVIFSSPDLSSS